mgnify:CR=1 FL=1
MVLDGPQDNSKITPLFGCQDIDLTLGGRRILEGVNLEVTRGQVLGIVGPNGAGKTTVFNLLSGVYDVDDGSINLDGKEITSTAAHDRVIYGLSRSFQNIRLMPHLSTIENVMLGQQATARGWFDMAYPLGIFTRNRWQEEAERSLAEAGIGTYPGEVVANLPYGIQKLLKKIKFLIIQV